MPEREAFSRAEGSPERLALHASGACAVAPRRHYTIPLPHRAPLLLGDRCLVMGILNITPDSFADTAHRMDPAAAVDAALAMQEEGADLIDIGGESTRPGATPVDAGEELRRVLPVVDALAARLRVPLSVDTYKAAVAEKALAAGVAIVNDISGLRFDPGLAHVVASAGAAIVLMHSRGTPATLHEEPAYDDVVGEVASELLASVNAAGAAGIPRERIIVDPGIGFAKRASHSYGVLGRLPELAQALDRPLLVGPSRKSFLRETAGGRGAHDRDWGTAAAVAVCVLGGSHIVRVHAVAEMVQVVRTAERIRAATL